MSDWRRDFYVPPVPFRPLLKDPGDAGDCPHDRLATTKRLDSDGVDLAICVECEERIPVAILEGGSYRRVDGI